MAEVLKTSDPKGSVSSNLTVSAKMAIRAPGLGRQVIINCGGLGTMVPHPIA